MRTLVSLVVRVTVPLLEAVAVPSTVPSADSDTRAPATTPEISTTRGLPDALFRLVSPSLELQPVSEAVASWIPEGAGGQTRIGTSCVSRRSPLMAPTAKRTA